MEWLIRSYTNAYENAMVIMFCFFLLPERFFLNYVNYFAVSLLILFLILAENTCL